MKPGAIVAIACMLTVANAQAAQWTADGLTVTLADATGAVEAVSVDGNELALASGAPGGLCYREFTLAPEESAQTALALDFEGDEVTWTQANMADWDEQEVWAERRTDGAAAGEGYLRIGGKPGAGMASPRAFEVTPGSMCTVSWRATRGRTSRTNARIPTPWRPIALRRPDGVSARRGVGLPSRGSM